MIQFSDHIAVLAESKKELLKMLENILTIVYNMSINMSKTKILVISKQDICADILLGEKQLDNMNEYLGRWIISD